MGEVNTERFAAQLRNGACKGQREPSESQKGEDETEGIELPGIATEVRAKPLLPCEPGDKLVLHHGEQRQPHGGCQQRPFDIPKGQPRPKRLAMVVSDGAERKPEE